MRHPREFWVLTSIGLFLPGVVTTKDQAEQYIQMSKASNDPNYIHVREVLPPSEEIKPTCTEVHQTDSQVITDQAERIKVLTTRIEGIILSLKKHGQNIDVQFHIDWLKEVLK